MGWWGHSWGASKRLLGSGSMLFLLFQNSVRKSSWHPSQPQFRALMITVFQAACGSTGRNVRRKKWIQLGSILISDLPRPTGISRLLSSRRSGPTAARIFPSETWGCQHALGLPRYTNVYVNARRALAVGHGPRPVLLAMCLSNTSPSKRPQSAYNAAHWHPSTTPKGDARSQYGTQRHQHRSNQLPAAGARHKPLRTNHPRLRMT